MSNKEQALAAWAKFRASLLETREDDVSEADVFIKDALSDYYVPVVKETKDGNSH